MPYVSDVASRIENGASGGDMRPSRYGGSVGLGWAGEKQDGLTEQERTGWIQVLEREQSKGERELRRRRSQPEGIARSAVS